MVLLESLEKCFSASYEHQRCNKWLLVGYNLVLLVGNTNDVALGSKDIGHLLPAVGDESVLAWLLREGPIHLRHCNVCLNCLFGVCCIYPRFIFRYAFVTVVFLRIPLNRFLHLEEAVVENFKRIPVNCLVIGWLCWHLGLLLHHL